MDEKRSGETFILVSSVNLWQIDFYHYSHHCRPYSARAGVGMDVKLRSLICLGLNEQVKGGEVQSYYI